MSNWYETAVFYELYIRAYADSTGDGNGDFRGAISKLDYIQSLGVDCIWIMPHYPSPLKDDGYDVADYRNIHPDYGTLDDFKAFISACHDRDLRVITDLVMNHTSDQHYWFQEARKGRDSPYHDYYVWSDTGTEYGDTRIIFLDIEKSNWTYDEVAGQYFWHRFYSSQPDLNYDNPKVHEEMFDIVRFWLDLGVDGFRADAVPYLYEREGTNCENLPETHQFLKKLREMVDREYTGRVLIAEANQWPQDLLPYFGNGDEFQICFHFPVMPRLYMALKRGDKSSILDILDKTPSIPAGTQWLTFLRNHDELTLEMVTPAEREWMWQQYAYGSRMKQNLGIRRRLASLLENHKDKWLMLNAILMSLMGTPIIYYGDEIGMGDNVMLPDRNGLRTPMQWNAGKNGGFSSANQTYFPVIDDEQYGYQKVNVTSQENDSNSYLSATRYLIQLRKQHPELQKGKLTILDNNDPQVFGYWRTLGEQKTLCLYNLSAETHSVSLNLGVSNGQLVDLLHNRQRYQISPIPIVIILRPLSSHWLHVESVVK